MKAAMRALAGLAASFRRDRGGASAVEFAMIAPVFLMVVAGIADVGGMLSARSGVNSAVTAGANYVLVNADRVGEAPGETAAQAAAVMAGTMPAGSAATVTVNGSFTVRAADGQTSQSGSPSVAGQCFCAVPQGGGISYGQARQCGSPCQTGGYAGRFVRVTVERPHVPLFGHFGVVGEDGFITVTTTVNVP